MVDGTAQKAAEAAAPAPAPAAPAEGLTALERALGVPGTPRRRRGATHRRRSARRIEIEGQRYTTAQLREAVLKVADYTQKTQELAQQRQAVQAQQEAFATVLPFLQPELQRLAQVVGNAPPMPDPALAQTDPTRYVQERAQYDAAMAEQQRLRQHHRAATAGAGPRHGAGGCGRQRSAGQGVPVLERPDRALRRTAADRHLCAGEKGVSIGTSCAASPIRDISKC